MASHSGAAGHSGAADAECAGMAGHSGAPALSSAGMAGSSAGTRRRARRPPCSPIGDSRWLTTTGLVCAPGRAARSPCICSMTPWTSWKRRGKAAESDVRHPSGSMWATPPAPVVSPNPTWGLARVRPSHGEIYAPCGFSTWGVPRFVKPLLFVRNSHREKNEFR